MFSPLGTSPGEEIASVLFAAGRGERLRPLTDSVAKPALPLLDVPLGAWGLAALSSRRRTVINVSHLPDMVTKALGNPIDVEYLLEEPEPFGTGGTLAAVRDRIGERIVCWNADMLTDLSVADLLATHKGTGAAGTIAVKPTVSLADFVIKGAHAAGVIDRRVSNRPGVQYVGVAVFEKDALHLLGDERPVGLTGSLLVPLLERGELAAHEHKGYSIDVGTIDRYLAASLDVLYERGPRPPFPLLGEIVEVDGGRAYIGPNAEVDKASLGPGAIVLAGAIVMSGAHIQNSVVFFEENVASKVHVSNSVWFRRSPLGTDPSQ